MPTFRVRVPAEVAGPMVDPSQLDKSYQIASSTTGGKCLLLTSYASGAPFVYDPDTYSAKYRLKENRANIFVHRGVNPTLFGAEDGRLGVWSGMGADISNLDSIPLTRAVAKFVHLYNTTNKAKIVSANMHKIEDAFLCVDDAGEIALAIISKNNFARTTSNPDRLGAWMAAQRLNGAGTVAEELNDLFALFRTVSVLTEKRFIESADAGGPQYAALSIMANWLRGSLSSNELIAKAIEDLPRAASLVGQGGPAYEGAYAQVRDLCRDDEVKTELLFASASDVPSYYVTTLQNLEGGETAETTYVGKLRALSELPSDLIEGIDLFQRTFDEAVKKKGIDRIVGLSTAHRRIIVDVGGVDGVTVGMRYLQIADALQTRVNNEMPEYGDILKKSNVGLTFADFHGFPRLVAPKQFIPTEWNVTDKGVGPEVSVSITFPPSLGSFQYAAHRLKVNPGRILDGKVKQTGLVDVGADGKVTEDIVLDVAKYGSHTYGALVFAEVPTGGGATADKQIGEIPRLSTDIPPAILSHDFNSTIRRNPTAEGQLLVKNELANDYFAPWAENVLEGAEVFVHAENTPPESGEAVPVKLEAGAQTEEAVNGLPGVNYVLSSRYIIRGGQKSEWDTTAPATVSVPAPAPMPATTADLVQNAKDAAEQLDDTLHIRATAEQQTAIADENAYRAVETYKQFALANQVSTVFGGLQVLNAGSIPNMDNDPAFKSDEIPKVSDDDMPEFMELRQRAQDAILDVDNVAALISDAERNVDLHNSRAQATASQALVAKIDDLSKQVEKAAAKDATVSDYMAIITKTTYAMPVDGMLGADSWTSLTDAQRTYLVANREKLRVLLEKGVFEKSTTMTALQLHDALQQSTRSSSSGLARGFQAPSERFLKARSRGIGKPFMKRNARRLRFYPA